MSRVLIADDNEGVTETCTDFLSKDKNIEIIDIVDNGIDALNSYINNKPDVLLLDLDMPGMDGVEVIEHLSESITEKKKNNIIVISGSLDRLHPYNTSKVYRILPKPLNFDIIIKTIYEIQGLIDDEFLEEKINILLFDLKLNSLSLKGIDYLKRAVFYCYNDETLFYNISKVYEMIAKDNYIKKIKPKNVLWSLESLIDTYEKVVNKDFLNSFFVYFDNTRNLTPKYLIELIVIHLKNTIK